MNNTQIRPDIIWKDQYGEELLNPHEYVFLDPDPTDDKYGCMSRSYEDGQWIHGITAENMKIGFELLKRMSGKTRFTEEFKKKFNGLPWKSRGEILWWLESMKEYCQWGIE